MRCAWRSATSASPRPAIELASADWSDYIRYLEALEVPPGLLGTDRPDLIPGRVSHGFIRTRNADILRLARLMPVGTPITIT